MNLAELLNKIEVRPYDLAALNFAIGMVVRLQEIEAAAKNLVAQKGRHNTETAYKRLEETLK